eukprot:CAMPEP_0197650270 /NCGR_PEP_ID=MMETSP1338-20131121/30837_1 /TAXON_ID=43686 ORGANISM="Pelagodinium beii, Strain RCC1491" /NCGR_SAMPLE_ID=MMETSP1338 /ASSEMBLY_ACC=CAM_ASM_000754 /LENGTH=314 /DNA_ID=CAMNT_0043224635 /DNA_START=62 /DNA_END=1006 /DNA_ORIENTATION=+
MSRYNGGKQSGYQNGSWKSGGRYENGQYGNNDASTVQRAVGTLLGKWQEIQFMGNLFGNAHGNNSGPGATSHGPPGTWLTPPLVPPVLHGNPFSNPPAPSAGQPLGDVTNHMGSGMNEVTQLLAENAKSQREILQHLRGQNAGTNSQATEDEATKLRRQLDEAKKDRKQAEQAAKDDEVRSLREALDAERAAALEAARRPTAKPKASATKRERDNAEPEVELDDDFLVTPTLHKQWSTEIAGKQSWIAKSLSLTDWAEKETVKWKEPALKRALKDGGLIMDYPGDKFDALCEAMAKFNAKAQKAGGKKRTKKSE